MQSQKLENLLNQALNATESERERSQELNVGYNPVDQVWELIIKYSGNLEIVRQISERVTELLNEYAIIHIRQSQIPDLVQIVEVEYVEKPKRLFFQVRNGKRVSCINEVQDARFSLTGQGVLVAVIDSGVDYTLPDFRNNENPLSVGSVIKGGGGGARAERIWNGSGVYKGRDRCCFPRFLSCNNTEKYSDTGSNNHPYA